MADRAAALGGHLTVEANPGGGTTVIAELPLAPTVAT
jgi:signal transduction histidine kinase